MGNKTNDQKDTNEERIEINNNPNQVNEENNEEVLLLNFVIIFFLHKHSGLKVIPLQSQKYQNICSAFKTKN